MKTILPLILVFLFLTYSCMEDSSKKIQKESVIINTDSIVLNKWVENITKCNPKISSSIIYSAKIGDLKTTYSIIPSDTFKSFLSDIAYDLTKQTPKISAINNVITIDYSTNDFIKFFIFKDKFIYSFHRSAGNNGNSIIYDFQKKKSITYYFIDSVTNNSAFFTREKYSFDKNHPGHYWQGGELDFKSNKIKWEKWEN